MAPAKRSRTDRSTLAHRPACPGRWALFASIVLGVTLQTGTPARGDDASLQCSPSRLEAVRFVSNTPLQEDDLLAAAGLHIGMELTKDAQEALRHALTERQIFLSIDIVPQEEQCGTTLIVYCPVKQVLENVTFRGNLVFTERELKRHGTPVTPAPLMKGTYDASAERIRSLYQDNGYREAQVTWRVLPTADRRRVQLEFVIDEGTPTRITDAVIDTGLPENLADLPLVLKATAEGKTATLETLREIEGTLLSELRKRGYWRAWVGTPAQEHIDAEGSQGLRLRYKPVLGRPLELVLKGNENISAAEILANLRLEERRTPFSLGLIRKLPAQVVAFYQSQGYFFATCTIDSGANDPEKDLFELTIDEGPKSWFAGVEFEGNRAFSSAELRAQIGLKRETTLQRMFGSRQVLTADTLSAIEGAVRELYLAKGYDSLRIDPRFEVSPEKEEFQLTLAIEEGAPRSIETVNYDFQDPIPEDLQQQILAEALDTTSGSIPFDESVLAAEVSRIQTVLTDSGHPTASVAVTPQMEQNAVTFTITSGPLVQIGRTVIQGNVNTRDEVIQEWTSFREGDLWRDAQLAKTTERLRRLGIFRGVTIEPLDGALDDGVEDVAIRLEERDSLVYSGALGLDTEDGLHLAGAITQYNLWGEAYRFTVSTDLYLQSDQNILQGGNSRISLATTVPASIPYELGGEVFGLYSLELFDPYDFSRTGGKGIIYYPALYDFSLRGDLQAYRENVSNVDEGAAIGPADLGITSYVVGTLRLDYDRRDNPLNPRKGYHVWGSTSLAPPAFDTEAAFVGGAIGSSYFLPLHDQVLLVARAEAKANEPVAGADTVPITSRFFLGGRSSLRGFARGEVGPRSSAGAIAGGDRALLFTAESVLSYSDTLATVLFVDMGQAFLANKGSFEADPDVTTDLRVTPGLGLRYITPVGPIRLEYGFVTDRQPHESPGHFQVSIGATF